MAKVNKPQKSMKAALSKGHYFNREISWLAFNQRVIDEAFDSNNPYLEQLRFLAIASSNADEFFMVRVAGVYAQYVSQIQYAETKTYLTPLAQLKAIRKKQAENVDKLYRRYHQLIDELPKYGFHFKRMADLSDIELNQAHDYFQRLILPTLSPLGIDAYRPFPHLNNKAINVLVHLRKGNNKEVTAIIPIPTLIDRYVFLANGSKTTLILTEDLIIHYIDHLFKGSEVRFALPFRITRDADFDIEDEDVEDLITLIQDTLKKRQNGAPVRLEIDTSLTHSYQAHHLETLMDILKLEDFDLYQVAGPLDLTYLFALATDLESSHPDLAFRPFEGALDPAYLGHHLFNRLDQGDILLYHPYDSFQPVESFIQTAAQDPTTIAIKQTLYRVSKDSPIVSALKLAAQNGKEVTVLVELKARFDEANNVHWAKELEEAGCHVLYGVSDLKTHSKICLVIQKHSDRIQSYLHLGTGNYNDKTAKIYTDFSLLTANPSLNQDARDFFNHLSGFMEEPVYDLFWVSPHHIKSKIMDAIDQEISNQKAYNNGYILAKMNSLSDKDLIDKFYQASQAGVKVDLIVRGICCLRPGIPDLSENIQVRSIVGRYLEHARAYFFYHNGQENLYLSSADLMTRNMEKRIEIAFPIIDQNHKQRIVNILKTQVTDTVKARVLQADGSYVRPEATYQRINSQDDLMKAAQQKLPSQSTSTHPSSAPGLLARLRHFFIGR